MSIKKIDKNELRGYEGKEGLILQGCGGNPQEWVDGINDLFTKEGILLDGTKFSDDNCAVFENNGLTCLLYEFNDDTKVDIGKLAMWRIGTHSDLGGTWLSDYVENKLGGFSLTGTKKPDCPLIGQKSIGSANTMHRIINSTANHITPLNSQETPPWLSVILPRRREWLTIWNTALGFIISISNTLLPRISMCIP